MDRAGDDGACLHPGVALSGGARDHLRLPCFWFGRSVGVLPAFGAFTGLMPVRAQAGDRLFAIADDRVMEVPPPVVERLAVPD